MIKIREITIESDHWLVGITRPILPTTGEVFCEGRILHRGRTVATSEAYLRDAKGKLLAHGTETCVIFPIATMMRGEAPSGS